VKLGLAIGYWGLGVEGADVLRIAHEAERVGYDSIWAAEAYGSDAVSVLGWLAGATTKINIGSAILQIPGRSPALTAMTAATLDQISGGRMRLGLGSSGPVVSEGWHGVRFAQQLQRTREYVAIVRKALAREHLAFDGEQFQLPLPDGLGKPIKLTIGPVQEPIPIYLAALGPKNVQLAGEIADGWIPMFLAPEHMDNFLPDLEQGAARAGRTLDRFDIAPSVNVYVTDDIDAGRDAMRSFIALYVGGMGARGKNFYTTLIAGYGFEEAVRRVQDLYLDGKKREAEAALPVELIDAVSLVGPADAVRERLQIYRDAGVGTFVASTLMHGSVEAKIHQLRIVAELASETVAA
jgi:F420-dependent oxidoreductase-like protein